MLLAPFIVKETGDDNKEKDTNKSFNCTLNFIAPHEILSDSIVSLKYRKQVKKSLRTRKN